MNGPSVPGARRRISERNVEAILDAAEGLLRSGRSLNFSAVASEAGVSRPTVYAHFADRHSLVAALVDRSVREAVAAIESARPEEGPPPEALRRLLLVSWKHLAHHLEVARTATEVMSVGSIHAHHQQAEDLIAALILRGQHERAFRDDLGAEWLASTCLAVIHSAAAHVGSGRMDMDTASKAIITTVVDLCSASRSAPKRQR